MYCAHCGQQIPADASFCNHCGKAIKTESRPQPQIKSTPSLEKPQIDPGTILKKRNKKWLGSLSSQTKTILTIGLVVQIIHAFGSVSGYLFSQQPSIYLARASGAFFAVLMIVSIISGVISVVAYFIFKDVAETYKRYLDYFSVTFLVVTLIIIYFSFNSLSR